MESERLGHWGLDTRVWKRVAMQKAVALVNCKGCHALLQMYIVKGEKVKEVAVNTNAAPD